jgi:hypothetical protein
MSLLTIYLCLLLSLSSSLAMGSFHDLLKNNLYPATTYDDDVPSDPGASVPSTSRTGLASPAWIHLDWRDRLVHSNLQPAPHYLDPKDVHENSSNIAKSLIRCRPRSSTLDCKAAINLIPTGHLLLDPISEHSLGSTNSTGSARFNLHLPRPLQKFYLPAAFRTENCMIFVGQLHPSQWSPTSQWRVHKGEIPRHFNAAKFMYHTVWPNSRRLAKLIQKQCGNRGGSIETISSPESNLEFKEFRYRIIIGQPNELEGVMKWLGANIYE